MAWYDTAYYYMSADHLTITVQDILNNELLSETPVITVDLDEMMGRTAEKVIEIFNQTPGLSENYRAPISQWWQLTKWLVENEGWDEESARQYEAQLWNRSDVLSAIEPDQGMQSILVVLSGFNLPVHVVTGRDPNHKDLTEKWVNAFFPWISIENIHIRDNDNETPSDFKARIVNELGAIIHFEDSSDDSRAVLEQTEAYVVFFPHESDVGAIDHWRLLSLGDLTYWLFLLQTHQIDYDIVDLEKKQRAILEGALVYGW